MRCNSMHKFYILIDTCKNIVCVRWFSEKYWSWSKSAQDVGTGWLPALSTFTVSHSEVDWKRQIVRYCLVRPRRLPDHSENTRNPYRSMSKSAQDVRN